MDASAPAPVTAPAAEPVPGRHDPSGPSARPSVRAGWLVAGLGATLVLTSIAGVVSWGALTGGLRRGVEEHQTYRQPVSALTVQGGSGDIEVRGGAPAGTVEVDPAPRVGAGVVAPDPARDLVG